MSKNKYFYSIDNNSDCYEIETSWDIEEDSTWAAEDAADDYYSNHDGWEDKWPLTVNLHRVDEGEVICTLKVELEFEPSFSATKGLNQ